MSTRITDLSSLDSDLVQQEDELLAEMLQEDNPSINAKQGVFRDYLAHYGGVLSAKNQTEIEALRRSQSLLAVQADPTLADDEAVDNISSNFRVSRQIGAAASGEVTIVVSVLETLTVAVGTLFEAQGQQFATRQAYTARTSSNDLINATDRVLEPVGDGTYSFPVTVTAVAQGIAGNLKKDTYLSVSPVPTNYVKAFASQDFIGGADTETNQDLIERYIEGLAAKAFSGRENMSAAVKAETEFAGIVADSLVGFGDPEMQRDQHSIFPGSLGGRVDWYIRTQPLYRKYGETREATLVEKTADGFGIWQMSFDRDEYPGMYDAVITSTSDAVVGEFEIMHDIRSADMAALSDGDGFLPDIVTGIEATFSRFQSVVLQFRDDITPTGALSLGSTADYAVTVRAMPQIAELQAYALRRRVRNVMGDALIKAPVPCFLTITLTVELREGQAAPDTDAIIEDMVSLVNYYGFTGRLPASKLADVIHDHLEPGTGLSAIDMFGKIQKPSGEFRYIRSTETLEVPAEAGEMSTGRTVAFFLDPADVTINITTAESLQI